MSPTLLLLLTALTGSAAASEPRIGQCDAEAEQILGRRPAAVGAKVRAPKKVRHVAPRYSTHCTSSGEGFWLGEALIDTKGNVVKVWTISEPRFHPPWPEFSNAISDALLQWKYTATVVAGVAVPVCVTVRTTIHWR